MKTEVLVTLTHKEVMEVAEAVSTVIAVVGITILGVEEDVHIPIVTVVAAHNHVLITSLPMS